MFRKRDKWELDDDRPMLWRATVAKRARAIGERITEEARWELFALQAVLETFTQTPGSDYVSDILLYGPLASGAPAEVIALAVIVRAAAPPAGRARVWDDLDALFVDAERMYALRFDCVVLSQEEISDPQSAPHAWQIIAADHVIVWSAGLTH
jgi:hypothetical protein